MTSDAPALRYAVRPRVVAKYVGQLGVVFGCLMVAPALVALASGEIEHVAPYGAVALGAVGVGYVLSRVPFRGMVQANEGMVVVALVFLAMPLIAALALMPEGLGFGDALFEAVSGVTTTGLTTVRAFDDVPRTFLFSRAWMQWYGGLGLVVLSLAIVVVPGAASKGLAASEGAPKDLVGGMRAHARRAVAVYAGITVVGAGAIWTCGAEPFTALVYALAAISTGGFSPSQNSLAGLGSPVTQGAVTLLCLAGAVPLAFWDALVRRRPRHDVNVLQLEALLVSTALVTGLLVVSMRLTDGLAWAAIVRHAPVLGAAAQSTAGFSTIDVSEFSPASKGLLILAMMVGGGAGSTAGGVKLLRILIAIRLLQVVLVRTLLPPDAVITPRLRERVLGADEVGHALVLIVLFVGVVAASWVPFLLAGHDPLNALFEVVSATATVGLSAGITSTDLAAPLKLVLCADMLLGRLEFVAWLVLLNPGTWLGHRRRYT